MCKQFKSLKGQLNIIEHNINSSGPQSFVIIIEKTHQFTVKLLTKQLFFNLFGIQHNIH